MSNHDHIKFYRVSLLLSVDTRSLGKYSGGTPTAYDGMGMPGGPNCSPVDFIEVPDGCPAEILSIGYEPRIFEEPDDSDGGPLNCASCDLEPCEIQGCEGYQQP